MRKFFLILGAAALLVVLTACSGSAPTQVAPTEAPVTITMVTTPAEPKVGDVTIQFTVVDDQGQPVTGADFDVIGDHTDMSGMIMHGKATEQSSGVYAITANFSMSGNWKLSVQVKKDALDYKQDIEIKIN